MPYDAVVFDMDGVLVTGHHTEPAVYEETADRLFDAFDADPPSDRSPFVSPEDAAAFRRACETLDIPAEEAWAHREEISGELAHERIDAGERELYDGVETVRDLAATHALGIVSNNRQATVDYVVEFFDLEGVFDVQYGREATLDGHERRKPDAYYLELALEELGTRNALYVGDRRSDVRTAENAGIDAALLRRPGFDPGEGPAPDHALESLDDLPAIV